MNIQITSDSTCDLSPEQLRQYRIVLMPLAVAMDGRDYHDGVDIQPQDIYDHVAKGGGLPVTAAVNAAQYEAVFAQYARDYDAVIHVNISAEFSSCYQNACLAAQQFDNVYVVDSRNLSTGHGLVVLRAAELAEQGVPAAEIVETLREMTSRVEASFILDQLQYLKKGGRCSAVAVLGANLLKLKPCIEVRDGKMGVGKKYRGSFDHCLEAYITDQLSGREDLELSRIFITHSGVEEHTLQVALDTVRRLQPFAEICVTRAGCTISSHCGPGTIGVLFVRKNS
ncbi:MAG TPA: DegV family protein [Candidatus Avoscillospira avicola]|uniref:DegV family protein n=1 Tax=Candidatus Avoscillospira avicola TaxID=2840706 RepID=A0A9D1AQ67_9FIRM|nr:DegV family protein [Candidatus Avoscillospira avicola]